MREIIKNFNKQFEWEGFIENKSKFKKFNKFVIVGMGGSGLAGGLLKAAKPELDIAIHRNYGLPTMPDLKERFIILNSYSGNTEEILDAFNKAREMNLPMAAISVGGKLLELAKKYSVPFIQLPEAGPQKRGSPEGGLQPRMALGHQIKALLEIIGDKKGLKEAAKLVNSLNASDCEKQGKNLAQKLKGFIPIIYSSARNSAIAYGWKIKFNETSKIPAFYNVFPELNHNEINGFENLSQNFYFIFLKDSEDFPQIKKRMEITAKLFREKKLPVEITELNDKNSFHKIFSSLVLADWTSYYLAEKYGVDPEQTPMIEDFKKLME